MSKKYIIELDEDPHNIRLMQLKNGGDGVPVTEFKVVCPYKEPDLKKAEADGYAKGYQYGYDCAEYDAEQTRRDAYKEGYKDGKATSNSNLEQIKREVYKEGREDGIHDGMCDAWEAARKIMLEKKDGGFTFNELNDIFGSYSMTIIFQTNTAAEAIAKIKAGEEKRQKQEQEREIKIGDEIIFSDGKKGYIIEIDGLIYKAVDENWKTATWSRHAFSPTGKNIPEIAIALQKIKGE